jgi:hypothetical protein
MHADAVTDDHPGLGIHYYCPDFVAVLHDDYAQGELWRAFIFQDHATVAMLIKRAPMLGRFTAASRKPEIEPWTWST